ncbi:MAG: hypothetical protein WCI88_14745 [Chloroflexota bacterium]
MKRNLFLKFLQRIFWAFQIALVITVLITIVSPVKAAPLAQEPAPTPSAEETLAAPAQPSDVIPPMETENPEPTPVPTEPPLEPIIIPTDIPVEPPSAGLTNTSPNISTSSDGTVSINYVKPITLYARNTYEPYILPSTLRLGAPKVAPIIITYRSAGQVNALGDTCIAFPTLAKNAFMYAASQWRSRLTSAVTISIEACWANLPSGVLGHSATMGYSANFPGAPRTNTWYPRPLADKLRGTNINPGQFDISIAYANGFSSQFYYASSGSPGTKYDFIEIVMHEITHGLGFAGSMRYSSSKGSWGYSDGIHLYPTIYDRFTIDSLNRYLINTSIYPNPSIALGTKLRSNAIYFYGPYARAANSGLRVALYAPGTWAPGSSYAHLAESFNTTTSKMMTYSIPRGEAVHDPGPVTKGILRDEGWGIVY